MPQSLAEYPDVASTKASIMLMAPSKAGKSIASVLTSPPPVYVACADPKGLSSVLRHAQENRIDLKKHRIEFDQINSISDWEKCCSMLSSSNKYATVVVDTISILSTTLELELKRKHQGGGNPFEMWNELVGLLAGRVNRLCQGNYHVILNCHAIHDVDGGGGDMGHVPAVSGKSKGLIMALMNDLLWLEVTPGDGKRPTAREFLLGPQGDWKHGCRSLKSEGRMDANISSFLKKAGIK